MSKDTITQRLMATFLGELEEQVRALDDTVLALERTDQVEERHAHLTTLFRIAHSLKGAARAVNVGIIETACHHLEEILTAERPRPVPLSDSTLQLLLEAGDALEEAGRLLGASKPLDGGRLTLLLPRLQATARAGVPAADRKQSPPRQPGIAATDAGEKTAAGSAPSRVSSVVPVAPEKLDTLMARGGELLIARRRIDARVEDATSIHEATHRAHTEWRRASRVLRRMLPAAENQQTGPGQEVSVALRATTENLAQLERETEQLCRGLGSAQHQLDRVSEDFHDDVRALRLTPFARATEGLDRTVRDLARELDREVHLSIDGGDIEIDRAVVEALRSPLIQLVRNAVAHGIEPPEERRSKGKEPRGVLSVGASLQSSRIQIVVADDGRGIDLGAIREEADRRGMTVDAGEESTRQLIFTAGFSTAATVTGLSGRGVGLDIVKSRIEALRGSIQFESERGKGTRFILSVPLTMTTIRALLLQAAGETFALETLCIVKLLRVTPSEIRSIEGRESIALGEEFVPLADLAAILRLSSPVPRNAAFPVVVIESQNRRVALVVDSILDELEILVTSLGSRFARVHGITGATLLPDGAVALIMNPAELLTAGIHTTDGAIFAAATADAQKKKRRVLVADDSVTTRALEKSILEAAGYEVIVAPDGMAAWDLLQHEGADLVVSDVEMPRMDGFTLAETIRSSARFRTLPVVLVTALAREADRQRGLQAGADAYLVKSSFDQTQLIETIAELL